MMKDRFKLAYYRRDDCSPRVWYVRDRERGCQIGPGFATEFHAKRYREKVERDMARLVLVMNAKAEDAQL